MKRIAPALIGLLLSGVIVLLVWRALDARALTTVWLDLAGNGRQEPPTFDPARLADQPEPVRRFFGFAIKPGTPLHTVVEVAMHGELSLGTREAPDYVPMRACQILAPPAGFIWDARAGNPVMPMQGSDAANEGASWTRFWLYGFMPIARQGRNADHWRSSFGRYMGEAIFWSPASLLPSDSVSWEATGPDSARVTITYLGLQQAYDLTLDAQGQPATVSFMRWSDANEAGSFRLQPFGGSLSRFQAFDGFRVPTRVEAGNQFGTSDYFPTFKADITHVHFVRSVHDSRRCQRADGNEVP